MEKIVFASIQCLQVPKHFEIRRKHLQKNIHSSSINHESFGLQTFCTIRYRIAGKFGWEKLWRICFSEHLAEKVWRMNRSANRLSIVTTNLDGFSLANHGRFAKLSPR